MKTDKPTREQLTAQKKRDAELRRLDAQFEGRLKVVDSRGRPPKGYRFDQKKGK